MTPLFEFHTRHRFFFLTVALLALVLATSTASAQVFDFSERCQRAYKEIIQLRLQNGQTLLNEEKRDHPENLIPYFLENYIDFFVLFFNEEPGDYTRLIKNLDTRLDIMNKGPKNSPYFLFTKSVIHFQWAAVRIKFGHHWDAGWQLRRAYLQIKQNTKSFPAFTPNLVFNGAMQVAVGTIPDGYKWLSNLFGMKGSIREGMQILQTFLKSENNLSVLFHDEAVFYFLYLKFYMENDQQGVFRYINSERLDVRNNHLLTYLAVNLSLNGQQAENAKRILLARNMSSEYLATSAWDLEMGYVCITQLSPDAGKYFKKFVDAFNGRFYLKDALQKLSWHYYLQGDQQQAEYYRKQILLRGSTDTDADEQAMKEAKSGQWPNKLLLKARLLNDGGYHMEALRLLHGKRITDFSSSAERLEFAYRVARIYDDLGRDDEAIAFYKQAVFAGEHRKEYFASRAALQIGYIYEERKDKQLARSWFQRSLEMKDHEFKNSIDQRAKAGIERCSE